LYSTVQGKSIEVTSTNTTTALKCNDEHPPEDSQFEEQPLRFYVVEIIVDMCRAISKQAQQRWQQVQDTSTTLAFGLHPASQCIPFRPKNPKARLHFIKAIRTTYMLEE
jgi:hypothetical protein